MSDKTLDRVLTLELVRVTERAAVAASYLIGRGNEKEDDQAAVDAMGDVLVTKFDFNKKEYEFTKGGY